MGNELKNPGQTCPTVKQSRRNGITHVLTSHRPSGVPSPVDAMPSRRGPEEVVGPGGSEGREFSRDSLRTRLLALSLYNLSSSWTKCVSSSPGLTVTPHTGQQDGSDWNFFFPRKHSNRVKPAVSNQLQNLCRVERQKVI